LRLPTSGAVAFVDLIRTVGGAARRGRIAILLVLATALAEVFDLAAEAGPAGVTAGGPEVLASFAGLASAAVLGAAFGARGRRRPSPRIAGRAAALTLLLLLALVVHEAVAVLLHAEHGEGAGHLLVHLAAGVLPVAVVLGTLVAVVAGVRVVRRVVGVRRRRARAGVPVADAPAPRRAPRHDVVPAGLLPALRLAGRAPPRAAAA
jgi:hypothetical protein